MNSSLLTNDEFVIDSRPPSQQMQNAGTSATGTINTNARRKYPIVQLVAPETLSEGFTFDVEVNHEILTVVVVSYFARLGICLIWHTYLKETEQVDGDSLL